MALCATASDLTDPAGSFHARASPQHGAPYTALLPCQTHFFSAPPRRLHAADPPRKSCSLCRRLRVFLRRPSMVDRTVCTERNGCPICARFAGQWSWHAMLNAHACNVCTQMTASSSRRLAVVVVGGGGARDCFAVFWYLVCDVCSEHLTTTVCALQPPLSPSPCPPAPTSHHASSTMQHSDTPSGEPALGISRAAAPALSPSRRCRLGLSASRLLSGSARHMLHGGV